MQREKLSEPKTGVGGEKDQLGQDRVGTSHSIISRIESGQHPTSVTALCRLAAAFETHLVVGFSDEPEAIVDRELEIELRRAQRRIPKKFGAPLCVARLAKRQGLRARHAAQSRRRLSPFPPDPSGVAAPLHPPSGTKASKGKRSQRVDLSRDTILFGWHSGNIQNQQQRLNAVSGSSS